ncbi:uncharacterized protein [Panulirus ornatus]|uniref:uncharacterized protein n=1 Tax=Panulirus ornatus TaxID=150431 RepID=UPI003A84A437
MFVGGEETRSRPLDLGQQPTPDLQRGDPRLDGGYLQPGHTQQEDDIQEDHEHLRGPTECEMADPTPLISPPRSSGSSQLQEDSDRQGVGQTLNGGITTAVGEAGSDSPPPDQDDRSQSQVLGSKNERETVLENVERMVISVVKRDTMRVNSEGKRVGHRQLYTKTILRDILNTRKIRHRRHKAAQMANQPVENSDDIFFNNLLPSFSSGDMSNALQIGVPLEDNTWHEEHRFLSGEEYERDRDGTYEPRYGKGGRQWRPAPTYSSPVDEGLETTLPSVERGHSKALSHQKPSVKHPSGRNAKPKFHVSNHGDDIDTYMRKMNFRGYQRQNEEDRDSSSSRSIFFDIQADANNISNDLSKEAEVELTNYVEEPMVFSSVSPLKQLEAPTLHPVPSTTPLPTFASISGKLPTAVSSQSYADLDSNLITPTEDDPVEDADDVEASVAPTELSSSTSNEIHDPAYIPAKLPFGPFLPSMRRYKGQESPGSVMGKFKPFFVPDDKRQMKKPNAGNLLTNVLSPIFGVQQGRSKSRGQKLLEYDSERSHNEELYNRVSGSFMPDFNSESFGYVPETYPYFPLVRRNKHRMFTSSKLHGGFAFIDRKHEGHDRPSVMEPPLTEDPRREQNLLIFGSVGDESIMNTLKNCSKYTTLQLIDHYSMDELIRESSSPLRQLIVYINLKSVNYEGYTIVVERTKRIIDYLSSSQGGVTVYSVIPIEEEAINTTKSKEVKTQLLNLNDDVLDHCAQDYPTCYSTYSLSTIIENLKRTYSKSSGFDVYDVARRGSEACASNEVCGTRTPPTASSGTRQLASPERQLADLAQAVCLSSYHLVVELVANMPTYDYEDYVRAFENAREESIRVRAQTGLVLHDILPRDLKKYDKNRPPKYEGQATIVYFHVTVLSVDSINEESMTYVADIFLAQSWRDHRLRLPENMTEEYRILDVEWLHNIWRPDCFFKNAKRVTFHEMSVPNHYLWLYHDKTLLYMAKLTLVLSCAMKFEAYPHDTQICSMMIESLSHTTHDLVFKWNETDPLVVNPDIELPQLDISRNNTEDCTLTYSTGNFTCLAVVFNLRRRLGYHLFHTYVPSAITVVMSWISFWIKPEAIPARVTLGVTSLLTLATQNQQSQSSLPPVSYIKAIDVWMSSCTVFVFASLLQFGLVNYFMEAEPLTKDMTGYSVEDLTDLDEKKSEDGRLNGYSRSRSRSRSRLRSHSPGAPQYVVHRCSGKDIAVYIDKFSRFFFPFAFFVLNVSYWTTYGTM